MPSRVKLLPGSFLPAAAAASSSAETVVLSWKSYKFSCWKRKGKNLHVRVHVLHCTLVMDC